MPWEILARERDKLETIQNFVRERYEKSSKIIYYETYNPSHCKAIINMLEKLLDINRLTNIEKFLLIASAWLYPQSLIPWGIRSIFNHPILRLQPEEASAIGEISKYQRKSEDINSCKENINFNGCVIRLKLLAAYLRLADTLHKDIDIPKIPHGINLMASMPDYEKFHWLKKIVSVINPDPSYSIIEVSIDMPDEWEETKLISFQNKIIEEIKEELYKVKNILITNSISAFLDVIPNILKVHYTLQDKIELERIINDFELSISPNASKIIEIVLKNITSIIEEGKIKELHEYFECLRNILDQRPCHIGLKNIWKHFQPYLKDIDTTYSKDKIEARIKKIKEECENLKEKRKKQINKLVKNAVPFLSGGKGILLFGYSDSVLKALGALTNKNDTLIYVSECRNKTKYAINNRMEYCDGVLYAAKVKEKGFKYVRIIPDIAIADFLKKGNINRVVLGANGIDEETHAISHTVGYQMIVDIAKEYSVPVYILADSSKFGKLNPMPYLERAGHWLTTEKIFEDIIKDKAITILNPREEIITQDKITALITDKGVFPKDVSPEPSHSWKPYIYQNIRELIDSLKSKIRINIIEEQVEILNEDDSRKQMDELVYNGVFNPDEEIKDACQWIIRNIGYCLQVIPASIYEFYKAKSSEKILENISVPAINIRGLTYDLDRAIIRSAMKNKSGSFIFEIARTEINYTSQTPEEYAMVAIAAAIRESYKGPLFIQGDHFKVDQEAYKRDKRGEMGTLKDLIKRSIEAGFFNIDIDTSTLVDLNQPIVALQQRNNFEITAELTKYIHDIAPPGITISIGGEIGEIGGKNSTERELKEYLEGFNKMIGVGNDYKGLTKIAVQTGTAHGGVPLPDGTIALVNLDFNTLEKLSKIAREEFGLAGCVQHGASTLPSDAFPRFPATGTAEVHLATEFQNMIYDDKVFPEELRNEIYDYLKKTCAKEKKENQTEEQFIYKTRKKGFGAFKKQMWDLPRDILEEISSRMEYKFDFLFKNLGALETYDYVQNMVKLIPIYKPIPKRLAEVLKKI